MSELERLEGETTIETNGRVSEPAVTDAGAEAPEEDAPEHDDAEQDSNGEPAAGNGTGPKKKRRRGSRGGKGRKKPGTGTGAAAGGPGDRTNSVRTDSVTDSAAT